MMNHMENHSLVSRLIGGPEMSELPSVPDDSMESLRFDDGNVNDNDTNQGFDWLNKEK